MSLMVNTLSSSASWVKLGLLRRKHSPNQQLGPALKSTFIAVIV